MWASSSSSQEETQATVSHWKNQTISFWWSFHNGRSSQSWKSHFRIQLKESLVFGAFLCVPSYCKNWCTSISKKPCSSIRYSPPSLGDWEIRGKWKVGLIKVAKNIEHKQREEQRVKGSTIVTVWDNQAGRILQLKYTPGAASPQRVPLKHASFWLMTVLPRYLLYKGCVKHREPTKFLTNVHNGPESLDSLCLA